MHVNIETPNPSLSFQLIDHDTGDNVILVANHKKEYDIWMSFLYHHCGYTDTTGDQEVDGSIKSIRSEGMFHAVEDIIADFFYMHSKRSLPVSHLFSVFRHVQ